MTKPGTHGSKRLRPNLPESSKKKQRQVNLNNIGLEQVANLRKIG